MTPRTLRSLRGLTLLEMLVVIAILAAVAAGTTALVSDTDRQVRFEDTRARLQAVRRAILGDDTSPQGSGTAGFVQDMGRLPTNLRELLEPTDASDQPLPTWTYDSDHGLAGGWRGPYLTGYRIEPGGTRTFRDGWNNPDTGPADRDYGWLVTTTTGTLTLRSRGADGTTDGGPPPTDVYARDYPDRSEPLVSALDHLVDLDGWTVRVDLGGATPSADVRAVVFHPDDGDVQSPAYVSSAAGTSVGDGVYAFVFGAGSQVPAGRRSVAIVDVTDLPGSGVGETGRQTYSVVLRPRSTPAPISFEWTLP